MPGMYKVQVCFTRAEFQEPEGPQRLMLMGVWYDTTYCGSLPARARVQEQAEKDARGWTVTFSHHAAGPVYRAVPVETLDEMPGDPIIPEVRNV